MSAVSVWVLTAAVWAGCLLGGQWWLAVAGLGLLVAAAPIRIDRGLRLVVVALALLGVGAGLAGGRAALRDGGLLPALADVGGQAGLAGVVVTEPRPVAVSHDGDAPPAAWFVVRVTQVDGRRVRERGVVRVDDLEDAPAVGERVALTAVPRALGDEGFDAYLRGLHVAARLDTSAVATTAPAGRLLASSTAVRERARAAFGRRLDQDRAALLAGVVVGDHRGRTGERAEQFAAAGLSHLVVVSGRHVALMLAVVLAAAAAARVGARGRAWLGLAAVAWFVVLVRWQPSVLRAGLMAALVLGAGLLGRGRDPRHVLGMAATVLLLADPALAGQLGFALSVLATAGVLVATPWLAERLRGPRPLRFTVAATLGAQAGAAPVLLAWLDGLPLWSVPANVVAVPAAGLAQVVGMTAAVVAQGSQAAGGLLAAGAGPPLAVVLWAAETFAAGPSLRAPDLVSPVTGLVVVAVLRRRRAPRQAWVAAVLAAALAAWPAVRPAPEVERLTVTAFDVGQGDALLVEVPAAGGSTARLLYDGGPDEQQVAATLRARGVRRLDAAVVSHPHHDHVAGVAAVIRRLDVGALIVAPPDAGGGDARQGHAHEGHAHGEQAPAAYHAALDAAAVTATPVVPVTAGHRFAVGDADVEVLNPPAGGVPGSGANDQSVVLRITTGDGSLLLTGDAEAAAQERLLARPDRLRADVLQVPHHGGNTNAEGFLAQVGADAAVISVGEDNPHGHPHPAVLEALDGTPLARTDRDGTVTIELDAGAARGLPGRGRRYTPARAPGIPAPADVPVRRLAGAAPAPGRRTPPRRAAGRW